MNTFSSILNNNLGIITLLAGGIAYFTYWKQKWDSKRDAAKIILQEIRRAEGIISEYKESHQYQFTKKIIVNNSWAKNIGYFVGDLEIDELDKITNLYSTGEYLDSVVKKVSDYQFRKGLESFEQAAILKAKEAFSKLQPTISENKDVSGGQTQSGQTMTTPHGTPSNVDISIQLPTPWKPLLEEITRRYEPIYNSPICQKLKRIAGLV